jgi:hypothetical protein
MTRWPSCRTLAKWPSPRSATSSRSLLLGLRTLVDRIQGEYAFNLGVKGCAYSTGTVNPTDTIIGTPATWIMRVADMKEMPGVIIKTQ